MKLGIGVVVVIAAAPVHADVSKGVPTVAMACVPDPPRLTGADGQPIVCWDETCIRIDVPGFDAQRVPRPATTAVPAWGDTANVSDNEVCMGDRCKPLGPKLRAAVAAVRAPVATEGGAVQPPPPIDATTDLAAVVILDQAWSTARDQPLHLAPPRSFVKRGEHEHDYHVRSLAAVGTLLVVDWVDCAGPCTVAQIADSRGRNVGGEVEGGGSLVAVDARHFAVVGESGGVSVLDGKGKVTGDFTILGGADTTVDAAPLEPGTLAVLSQDAGGYRVTIAHVDDKGAISRVADRTLPPCPSP